MILVDDGFVLILKCISLAFELYLSKAFNFKANEYFD